MTNTQPISPFRRNELYIGHAGKKGRGLFCHEDISVGEVIEISPGLVFPEADAVHIRETLFVNYCFSVKDLTGGLLAWAKKIIGQPPESGCLVLGVTSFCNHSAAPNAKLSALKEQNTVFYVLRALRDIPADEEIQIDYGPAWISSRQQEDNPGFA